MAIYGLVFGPGDPKMVPYEHSCTDGHFDVWHAHTRGKFPRKVPKMAMYGQLWPFMAIYGLVFGPGDPKMVPYEHPCPDGHFDVRHAHTQGKFP